MQRTEKDTRPEGGVKGWVKTTQKTTHKTTQKILAAIENNPSVTRQQLSNIIGITPDGVKKALERLKAAGLLRRVGPKRGGHWEIVNPQPPTGGPGS